MQLGVRRRPIDAGALPAVWLLIAPPLLPRPPAAHTTHAYALTMMDKLGAQQAPGQQPALLQGARAVAADGTHLLEAVVATSGATRLKSRFRIKISPKICL